MTFFYCFFEFFACCTGFTYDNLLFVFDFEVCFDTFGSAGGRANYSFGVWNYKVVCKFQFLFVSDGFLRITDGILMHRSKNIL